MKSENDFSILASYLVGDDSRCPKLTNPTYRRMFDALTGFPRASGQEIAILLRQVLQVRGKETRSTATIQVPIGDGWPVPAEYERSLLNVVNADSSAIVSLKTWSPDWLADSSSGVDTSASRRNTRRVPLLGSGSSPIIDPHLARLRLSEYRSHGQRAALRAALRTPAGSTLAICLPTGEGKSTVFHSLIDTDFLGSEVSGAGTVVVVVPTVALAIDHDRRIPEISEITHSTAVYGTQDEGVFAGIVERIINGTQGIVFVSPESACQRLRRPLLEAAAEGNIRALVVDEAHLIDSWGSGFRPEFQLLSGLRRNLMAAQSGDGDLRTILLSATFTRDSLVTLRDLFSGAADDLGNKDFGVLSSFALRPEIEWWVSAESETSDRDARVREAMMCLPRPAILYTSLVDDADRWGRELSELGFTRFNVVTGETKDKEAINENWINGQTDLIVATSAFGLGVDNPEVRSVIHACVPESIDRFYQEVGRGGRDGKASISLIIPAIGDQNIAGGLADPRLLTSDRAFERWRAMWNSKKRIMHSSTIASVPIDVPPGVTGVRIDMGGPTNTDWHMRTLNAMAACGLIELQGVEAYQVEDQDSVVLGDLENVTPEYEQFQKIEIKDQKHLDKRYFLSKFEFYRNEFRSRTQKALNSMRLMSTGTRCSASVLAPTYEVMADDDFPELQVQDACGGCPYCRSNKLPIRAKSGVPSLDPWSNADTFTGEFRKFAETQGNLLVPFSAEDLVSRRDKRRFLDLLVLAGRSGISNLIIDEDFPIKIDQIAGNSNKTPFFVSEDTAPDILPVGPTVILGHKNIRHVEYFLSSNRPWVLAFLHEEMVDPNVGGVMFKDRFSGSQMGLMRTIEVFSK